MYDDETYSHGYLMHYGRKGMKWYKHIFGGDLGRTVNAGARWTKRIGAKARRQSIDTYDALGDNKTLLKSEKGVSGIVTRGKARLEANAGNYVFSDNKRATAKKANAAGDVYVTTTNRVTGLQKVKKLNSGYTDADLKRDMRNYGVEKVTKISKRMDKGATYAESIISEHNKEVAYTYAVNAAKTFGTVAAAAAAFGLTRLYTGRVGRK